MTQVDESLFPLPESSHTIFPEEACRRMLDLVGVENLPDLVMLSPPLDSQEQIDSYIPFAQAQYTLNGVLRSTE